MVEHVAPLLAGPPARRRARETAEGASEAAAKAPRRIAPRGEVLDTGETAPPVRLARAALETSLRQALALADDTPSYVWVDGDSELAVHAARTRVALSPGTLLLGLTVECDQTGRAEVTVPFALGSRDTDAGLVMATASRPYGDVGLVERWGDVLVAAAYRALLDVVTAAAASIGVDADGTYLLPGAVSTEGKALTIVPQARHAIDRGRLL